MFPDRYSRGAMARNLVSRWGLVLIVGVALSLSACDEGDVTALLAEIKPPQGQDVYEGAAGDDTPATASNIAIGQSQARTVFPPGDVDWVQVNLSDGQTYEFSSYRLNYRGDTILSLYQNPASPAVATVDDYIFLDSRIKYTVTPGTGGTYYLKIVTFSGLNTTSYTLSAQTFVDVDGDAYSPLYDCNDSIATVRLFTTEVPGDGVDQNCDSVDPLNGAGGVADSFEPDNTPATAKPMASPLPYGPYEVRFSPGLFIGNTRTLHSVADEDWFVFTLAPTERAFVSVWQGSVFPPRQVYESDGVTLHPTSPSVLNNTAAPRTYYARFGPAAQGWYTAFLETDGVDQDGDTFRNLDFINSRDCNDSDATIYPGAPETPGDGVDSNCDGQDNL